MAIEIKKTKIIDYCNECGKPIYSTTPTAEYYMLPQQIGHRMYNKYYHHKCLEDGKQQKQK